MVSFPGLLGLVALGAEKREAEDTSTMKGYITVEEGIHLATTIGAAFYIECSEVTGHGVLEAFQEAAFLLCLHKKAKKRGSERCHIQ